jgi:drug/metabolite transporter (DMT)-like permease
VTQPGPASPGRATAIGFGAVLMWALLALLTVLSGQTPPFQLAAMCFLIGGAVGVIDLKRRNLPLSAALPRGRAVWALGVGGIFGYHALYFTALRNAPPAEAGLIAYLWPLLIVLFSGLLPGERLRWPQLLGAVLAFGGAALIVAGSGDALTFKGAHALGFAAAAGCALVWSGYSVLSRLAGATPTSAVTAFCFAASALSALCHLAVETTIWPDGAVEWAAVLALGLGPVGGAFYLWDVGVKRGDIQLLGVASYAAPLLSTLALIMTGFADARASLVISALLITGGAALAAMGRRGARAGQPSL